MSDCKAMTKDGSPCGMAAQGDADYCFVHDPACAAERDEARRRGGYHRRTPNAAGNADEAGPARLRSAQDVQDALERALADTWTQENSGRRTLAIVRLCTAALKALELAEIEQRLSALEERFEAQQDEQRRSGNHPR